VNSVSGLEVQIVIVTVLTFIGLQGEDPKLNFSLGSALLLLLSGAISSALLTSGYFLESFAAIGLTAVVLYFQERREKRSQSFLTDKPIY
jgi:hypothetical protein